MSFHWKVTSFKFSTEVNPRHEDPANISAGYDYIEAHAPRSGRGFNQLRWVREQMADPENVLSKWSRADVMTALSKLDHDANNASIRSSIPISLLDLSELGRQIQYPSAPDL